MIRCTTVGREPSKVCYEICALARMCEVLKTWEKEQAVAHIPIINMEATGKNIKRIRESRNVSVRELQDVFGFTNPQAIYKWQNGMSIPTLDNLVILASVLGTTIDDILVTE